MSSSSPIRRTSTGRAALLGVVWVLVLAVLPGGTAAATPADTPGAAVAAGTWDACSRLTVTSPNPGPVAVTVDGSPVAADVVPLLSDRTATAVVVDTSDAGRQVLQPGLSGAASFVLATSPAARSTLVADTTPPAVVSPLQVGPADTLRGLAEARAGGDRQTGTAVALALAQLPPEADHPRLVLLYTGAPDAPVPVADLTAALAASGAVLSVVVATDDGAVPPYWSQVAAATGGLAVAASGSGVVAAFDDLGAALRTRYLVSFPAPARLPAEAVVRVDTPQGPLTATAAVSAPTVTAGRTDQAGGSGPWRGRGLALAVGLVVLGLLAAAAVVGVRRRTARRPTRAAGPEGGPSTVWNVPARPRPAVGRDALSAELRRALQRGRPVVLHPAGDLTATGTTTAMVEHVHRCRADYDVVWWVPAADPPLIADRLAELAEVLGLAAPTDTAESATDRLLAELRRRRRWLLVFDDAGSPRQLTRFLPDGPGHVLIGSADPAWTEHATRVAVPPWRRTESTDLLRSRRPGLSAAEADRVAAVLDDLPLAVDVAGATLADTGTSVGRYLRLLGEHGRAAPPDPGVAPVDGGAAASACATAVDRLAVDDPSAVALLELVAWLGPGPVPLSLLTAHPELLPAPLWQILDVPARLADLLDAVVRRGLARVDPEAEAVTLHRIPAALLVTRSREASGEPGGDAAEWAAAAVRLLRAVTPADPTDPAGRRTWRRLLPHVLAVTDPARPLDGTHLEVGWLLHHAARHLQERGEARAARALFEDAHDLYARRLGPDHSDTVAAARALAAADARTSPTMGTFVG